MYTAADETTRERRLRRAAHDQGLRVVKSHLRDPQALSYGMFRLVDENNYIVAGGDLLGFSLRLDEVETYLADAQAFAVRFESSTISPSNLPVLEWWNTYPDGRGGTSGWLLTEHANSPQEHFYAYGRTELAQAARAARLTLAAWADDDRDESAA